MTPKVSVVVPTLRLGGMDVLFGALRRQTFKDYELVLVDEWRDMRTESVAHLADTTGVSLLHVRPDRPGLAHALNVGLGKARGKLVCPLNDYHWPPQDWLARHWSVFQRSGGAWTCNGLAEHHAPPALKPVGLDVMDYTMTVFRRPFEGNFSDLPVLYREDLAWTKRFRWSLGDGLYTSCGREYYNTLNNSIPRSVLLKINGYDETYDQSRAVLDIDAGVRAEIVGHRFALDTGNVVHVLSHEELDRALGDLWASPFRRPHEVNLEYMAERMREIEQAVEARHGLRA